MHAIAACPAAAQASAAPWPAQEVAEGVTFRGDGAIGVEASKGLPVLTFWRPVLFDDDGRPVAGRMDCRLVATEQPFTDAAFDLDARYAAEADRRADDGNKDEDRLRDYSETMRTLDVVGRRVAPHQHYVLSLIAIRDGERLVDIRRNCTFVHGSGGDRADFLSYVYRYTRLDLAFAPNAPAPEAQN